ncbi:MULTISPECIES: hypothetical protein [Fictibacillus]|uniref:hypothetical protein n=1 Tax=Fictibacillus TaxID=1329200 RepID=UPI0010299751|nr:MULTISPECIES: hypothetical protein [Fictibacillus]RZT23162.1 hypothetical protein EV282_2249 [Fictibacillus sp. BK138]
MSVNFGPFRDLFVNCFREQTVIAEVFLQNSNQPAGTPDLTGVRVYEVGGDFVVFSQAGSAGSGLYVVNLDRILLVEL